MDAVKVWCFSVCVALVIGAVVSMIVPSIDKQKIMRLVISAFILAGIISPMLTVVKEINISFEAQDYEEYLADIDDTEQEKTLILTLEDTVAKSLFPLVKKQLDNLNINEEFGIKVALSKEKEGITVDKVNISLSDLHMIDQDALENELKESLGLPISIDVN